MINIKINKKKIDYYLEKVFLLIGFSCVFMMLLIILFLFKEGIPIFKEISIGDFLLVIKWCPTCDVPRFGIFPLISASIAVTVLASFLAVPLSLAVAVYHSELSGPRVREIIKPLIEIIASIPSVVAGFFGMVVVALYLQNNYLLILFSIISKYFFEFGKCISFRRLMTSVSAVDFINFSAKSIPSEIHFLVSRKSSASGSFSKKIYLMSGRL